MKKWILFVAFLIVAFSARSQIVYRPNNAGVLFVDSASSVNPADYNWIGDSWDKAIPQLAEALRAADSMNAATPGAVQEIWVAKGTYFPMYSAEDGHHQEDGGKNNAFLLIKNVKIYGGFAGTETSLNERDSTKLFSTNRTILNGNHKVYHIIISSGDVGSAELNGFVIYKGDAIGDQNISIRVNNNPVYEAYGGGLYDINSIPEISNCIFLRNYAREGGGIYNNNASPKITHCIFSGNFSLNTGGGGVYNENSSEPSFFFCTFKNNVAYHYGSALGGGVYNNYSFPVFFHCSFTNNKATKGGAIYNSNKSESNLTNCILAANTATNWGGAIYNNNANNRLIGCLLSGNKADYGGAVNNDNGSKLNVTNCTIAGNLATGGGGSIYNDNNSSVKIINSIIWGNSSALHTGNGNLSVIYSILQSSSIALYSGVENLVHNPLFVHPVNYSEAPTELGNYEVSNHSWALNHGKKVSDLPETDLAGNPRLVGVSPDNGAYEIQGYTPNKRGVLYVNKNVSGGNGSGTSWDNAVKELSDALLIAGQINKVHSGTVRQIWVAHGRYYPLYSAEDSHRTEDGGKNNAFVLLKDVKMYGGFKGSETALSERDTIGLPTANKTILDGGGKSYHVVIAAGDLGTAEINGFIIYNGNADGNTTDHITVNGNPVYENLGAGLDEENSQFIIRHCNFIKNLAENVAGAFHSYNSSFTMIDCYLGYNKAKHKGGAMSIHNDGSPRCSIASCIFDHNSTSVSGSKATGQIGGGAIYNNSGTSLNIKNLVLLVIPLPLLIMIMAVLYLTRSLLRIL